MRRLQCRVQVGIAWTHERAFHADIRLESKELTKFAERECLRCLCPLTLGANTAKRRARDVHVEEGDVTGLEATIGGGVHALRHFLRGNQQPDPVIGVHRPVVRRCRERSTVRVTSSMLAELCAMAALAPSTRADRRAPGSKL